MNRPILPLAAAAAALAFAAAPGHAAVFTGTATATAMVGRDASCAPLPFRGIISHSDSSGSSNLGAFTYSHNACTAGTTGPVNGTFELDFSGALLNGSFTGGSVARPGTPGLFDQTFTYLVLGGTGRFAGATGSFVNVGTVDTRGGPPSRLNFDFDGAIFAAGVPEPGAWALLILGFGVVGRALRRRRPRPLLARA